MLIDMEQEKEIGYMNKIKNLLIKYKEIITYVIFGGLTTLVNWVVYTLLVNCTSAGITISNAIAWVASVIFAFVTNKIWVFESKSFKPTVLIKEFISFIASRVVTGFFEIAGVPLLVKIGMDQTIFGIKGMAAKLIVSVVVIILNYVFSKLIVFRKKKNNK